MKNPIAEAQEQVREVLLSAIGRCVAAGALPPEPIPAFSVEIPADPKNGDFATNAAMVSARAFRMAPRKIAEAIEAELVLAGTYFERAEIAGPGFINFYLSKSWIYNILPVVETQDTAYGSVDLGHGEKVQIEFVSANPTGLLHMGNARGGALGDSLANLLKMAGYDVTKEFYINDAGNQIVNLGLSLEARYRQQLGDVDYPFPEKGYHGQDITDTAKRIIAEVGDSYLQLPEEERQQK